jgi:8-oxo-dGTP pyrophosphatase MutT (NUDIX family)
VTESRAAGEGFSVMSEDVVLEWGVSSLVRLGVKTPEGDEVTRTVVRHPGAVSVVPVMDDGQTVVMVRQYRPAVGRALLELPAGTRDVPGELPEQTAARELMEEAGYEAKQWTKLCDFYNSPGSSDHHHWLYLAENLSEGSRASQDVEESHMTVEFVRLTETNQLIASGLVTDAKSIIGLLLARDYLSSR